MGAMELSPTSAACIQSILGYDFVLGRYCMRGKLAYIPMWMYLFKVDISIYPA